MTCQTTLKRLGRAKADLILDHPFFATILCSSHMVEDASVGTMGTDGKTFYYAPDFITTLSDQELKFVLCHEVGHCIFSHMYRKGARNHRKWNIAGDYIINQMLVDEKIGQIPTVGLLNKALVEQGGGTTDGVYNLLPDDDSGGGGGIGSVGGAGDPLDNCMDGGITQAEKDQGAADMAVLINQAAQAAKMCGKLSAGLERFAKIATSPLVNWKDVLRRFVSQRAKIDHSFARAKRRFLWDDLILPSLSGETLGRILVAVDCSGSIRQAELDEFATEINAVKEDGRPSQLHVVYFDSTISHHEVYEPDDSLDIRPHGGGGTAFSPIFAFAEEKDIDPIACIVLTDLCCKDFGPAPAYPVLWVTNTPGTAPWGEVVEMHPKGV